MLIDVKSNEKNVNLAILTSLLSVISNNYKRDSYDCNRICIRDLEEHQDSGTFCSRSEDFSITCVFPDCTRGYG